MDKIIKRRAPIRSMLTRTINESDRELVAENKSLISLKGKYEKLNGLQEQIQKLDQDLLEEMLRDVDTTDEDYEFEVVSIQDYVDKIVIMKLKIDSEIYGLEHQTNVVHNEASISSADTLRAQNKRKFKLPKIQLAKFSGRLLDWLGWWSQFEKIHKDEELHITDKFEYLRQAMEENTRAKEIVEGFPATEVNYPKAIKTLQERYGKKKLLIQVYVRELFKLSLNNLNKNVELISMYDKLVCHIRALESLGITVEQAALFLYPMVESSLPDEILIAWQRSTLYEKDGSQENPPRSELDYLLQFLEQEVERSEQRTLVKAGYKSKESVYDKGYQKKKENKENNIPTAVTLFNGQTKIKNCIFCEKTHESKDYGATEFWTMEEMKNCVKRKGACFHCLQTSHVAKTCKSFVKCHICSGRHHTIMCPNNKKEEK